MAWRQHGDARRCGDGVESNGVATSTRWCGDSIGMLARWDGEGIAWLAGNPDFLGVRASAKLSTATACPTGPRPRCNGPTSDDAVGGDDRPLGPRHRSGARMFNLMLTYRFACHQLLRLRQRRCCGSGDNDSVVMASAVPVAWTLDSVAASGRSGRGHRSSVSSVKFRLSRITRSRTHSMVHQMH